VVAATELHLGRYLVISRYAVPPAGQNQKCKPQSALNGERALITIHGTQYSYQFLRLSHGREISSLYCFQSAGNVLGDSARVISLIDRRPIFGKTSLTNRASTRFRWLVDYGSMNFVSHSRAMDSKSSVARLFLPSFNALRFKLGSIPFATNLRHSSRASRASARDTSG